MHHFDRCAFVNIEKSRCPKLERKCKRRRGRESFRSGSRFVRPRYKIVLVDCKLALFPDKPGVFYCTWIEIRFAEIAGNSNPRCYTLLPDKPAAAGSLSLSP